MMQLFHLVSIYGTQSLEQEDRSIAHTFYVLSDSCVQRKHNNHPAHSWIERQPAIGNRASMGVMNKCRKRYINK